MAHGNWFDQIWRLWLIWGATPYAGVVTFFPGLLFLSYIGVLAALPISAVGTTHLSVTALQIALNISTIHPDIIPHSIPFPVVVYGIGSATTILVTTLVSIRLLLVRRRHMKIMGKCSLKLHFVMVSKLMVVLA